MSKVIKEEEVEDIIEYHNNILGINTKIPTSAYISKKTEIFNLINLFNIMDADFNSKLIKKLTEDILSLFSYLDLINHKKNNDLTKYKKEIISLVNTKLYYLDLVIWAKVEKSKLIKVFLREKDSLSIHNSLDFISKNKEISTLAIKLSYKIDEINLKTKYKKEDLDFLFDLDTFKERRKNKILRTLIDSRHSISFFKNMIPEEIKHIVKDVEFIKYNKREAIVLQNTDSKEIYFIISGKCKVLVNSKIVGKIEENQIFGEFSSILKEKRNATIETIDETTVLRFNFAFELFKKDPYAFTMLYKNIIDELIKKIVSSNKRN